MEYYVYAGYDGDIIYREEPISEEVMKNVFPDKVFLGKFGNPLSFISALMHNYYYFGFSLMYIFKIVRNMFPETECKKIFIALKTTDGHYILYDKKMDFDYKEGKFEIPNIDIIKDLSYYKSWISLMSYQAIPSGFLRECCLSDVKDIKTVMDYMEFQITYEDDYSIVCCVDADMSEYYEYNDDHYDDFDTTIFYEKAIKFVNKEEFRKELIKCINGRNPVDKIAFV